MASPYTRQLLRDERAPRIERINALGREVANCWEAKAYDAALVMQFIQLDTWAFLTRPARMTNHRRASFMWFIARYMRDAHGQGYSYSPSDVYAARCGLLHTFGALADMHEKDESVVIWRLHLGKLNTFVPGLHRVAYISVGRFIRDAHAAVGASLEEVKADDALGKLFGERLPKVYFHAGVLPSRDPDVIAAMDAGIDADLAMLDGDSEERSSSPATPLGVNHGLGIGKAGLHVR
jgi:hypothetical protein